jgi:hypothetical protein
MDEDEKHRYLEKLEELSEKGANRDIIALLTEVASDNLGIGNGQTIVDLIEKRIREVC